MGRTKGGLNTKLHAICDGCHAMQEGPEAKFSHQIGTFTSAQTM